MSNKEWTQKILSKVSAAKRHGGMSFTIAVNQDADYARVVADNIERRKAERKAEKEAAA